MKRKRKNKERKGIYKKHIFETRDFSTAWAILRLIWQRFMGGRNRPLIAIPLTGNSVLESRYFVASNAIHRHGYDL